MANLTVEREFDSFEEAFDSIGEDKIINGNYT